jgi:hypothetical protein
VKRTSYLPLAAAVLAVAVLRGGVGAGAAKAADDMMTFCKQHVVDAPPAR